MRFRYFFGLISLHIVNTSLVIVTVDKFEMNYYFTFVKISYLTEHRVQILFGIPVAHCVKECAARKHCKALLFRTRLNVCELFSSAVQDPTITTESLTLQRTDLHIIASSCQDGCSYGDVCETNELEEGICKIKECLNTTIPENGSILGNQRSIGKKIKYRCNEGYLETNVKNSTVAECLKTGEWSTFIECVPSQIFYTWTTWTEWTTCSVSCGSGYKDRLRRCTKLTPTLQYGEEQCEENMINAARASCNKQSCN